MLLSVSDGIKNPRGCQSQDEMFNPFGTLGDVTSSGTEKLEEDTSIIVDVALIFTIR